MTITKWNKNTNLWNEEAKGMLDVLKSSWFDQKVGGAFTPATDVRELKEAYKINLELPGVDKKDLTIDLKEEVLTISGEKKSAKENEQDKLYWRERNFGRFSKSFNLNNVVKVDEITASFENGILTVTLPKAEERQPKHIEIK